MKKEEKQPPTGTTLTEQISKLVDEINALRTETERRVVSPWLTYDEAAAYLSLAPSTLRSLVSAKQIPAYGSARLRRFRKEMLDLWVVNRDLAMRKWAEERKRTW